MRLSTAFFMAGAVTYIAGFVMIFSMGLENVVGLVLILAVIGGFFFVRGSTLQDYEDDIITEEYVDNLKNFGKEQDGTYCDRWEFSIIPVRDKNKEIIKWSFCIFNEVNGNNTRVKYVETIGELKAIFKAISNEELE